MTDFLPTRRTLLGSAGAAALSHILLPWRPRPEDLLVPSTIERTSPSVTPLSPDDPRIMLEFTCPTRIGIRYIPIRELSRVSEIFVETLDNSVVRVAVLGGR